MGGRLRWGTPADGGGAPLEPLFQTRYDKVRAQRQCNPWELRVSGAGWGSPGEAPS